MAKFAIIVDSSRFQTRVSRKQIAQSTVFHLLKSLHYFPFVEDKYPVLIFALESW